MKIKELLEGLPSIDPIEQLSQHTGNRIKKLMDPKGNIRGLSINGKVVKFEPLADGKSFRYHDENNQPTRLYRFTVNDYLEIIRDELKKQRGEISRAATSALDVSRTSRAGDINPQLQFRGLAKRNLPKSTDPMPHGEWKPVPKMPGPAWPIKGQVWKTTIREDEDSEKIEDMAVTIYVKPHPRNRDEVIIVDIDDPEGTLTGFLKKGDTEDEFLIRDFERDGYRIVRLKA